MRRTNKIIITVIIISVMLLGIGYAAIQNITLNITGTATADPSQANFTVRFSGTPEVSDTSKVTAAITDDTNATINVEGLTNSGDTVTATYTVQNTSADLSADLSVETTNSNEEYFTIEPELGKTSLVAGEATTLTVTVQLIKTPISATETSTIGIQLTAEPVQPGEEGGTEGGASTEGGSGDSTSQCFTGTINVTDSMKISLDAKNWEQSIELTAPVLDSSTTLEVPYTAGDGTTYTYNGGANVIPSKLIPVSTTGAEDIATNNEIIYYTGNDVIGGLSNIKTTNEGFLAIDLFLQNASKLDYAEGEVQGESKETLQLNKNSFFDLVLSENEAIKSLKNTARVALAVYDTDDLTNSSSTVASDLSSVFVTANQNQILQAYNDAKISDITIWEPNSKSHIDYIVNNNNLVKLDLADAVKYVANESGKFANGEYMPTYALTSIANGGSIADRYDWQSEPTETEDVGKLKQQITTSTDTTIEEVVDLKSIVDSSENTTFEILKNSIVKLRMYVWFEGQDVDCTRYNLDEGKINFEIGLTKAE